MNRNMNPNSKRSISGRWLPLLIAIPFAVLVAFLTIRYGMTFRNLIHVAIKAVVIA